MGRIFAPFLALLFVSLALAQDNPQPQPQPPQPEPQLQQRPAEPANVPIPPVDRRITLDVQVTKKSGAPVRGLQKLDFTLLDDKRPQNILSFHVSDGGALADPPVEVVLVVDAVNVGTQSVAYERNELRKFLLNNGGQLAQPTSLIFFTDAGAKMQTAPMRDGKALSAMYDQYETGLRTINRSQGFWGAAERFDMSLKMLNSFIEYEKPRPGRKLMIWFSPGWPLLSGPNIQLSSKDEHRFFDNIVAASAGLRLARITLYSIDPLGLADAGGIRISYYEEFLKGVARPGQAQAANLSLQVLAVQTGGRVLNSSNDITKEIEDCTSDARYFYVISFDGARADQPNEYHAIEVKIDKPGVKARTRTGYYAQP